MSRDVQTDRVVFVDETKERGYLIVASAHVTADLVTVRRALRELVLPGQRRLHMKKESDRRRRAIVSTLMELGVQATLYDAGRRHSNELDARAACLERLVAEQPPTGALVVLEQDDSLVSWDRRTLFEITRSAGRADVAYEHLRGVDELALAVPHAIAWCWAKGGDWRRRAAPMIRSRHKV